ncbi:aldolase/citrate lyase family protein [Pelagibius marinus]|uniref:aldolase/citrate lyase family protein n=1 Tax=Pelagibius marinus TaxID=2762760 RepID=UPI0018730803|nr:aldolase/citrate lyase family protein [Pelagibius marinus]
MDLPRNPFKAAIKAGRQQIGLWCSMTDPMVAEILAGCGYDWLMFDTEHAAMDAITVLEGDQVVDVTEALSRLPRRSNPLPGHDMLVASLEVLKPGARDTFFIHNKFNIHKIRSKEKRALIPRLECETRAA